MSAYNHNHNHNYYHCSNHNYCNCSNYNHKYYCGSCASSSSCTRSGPSGCPSPGTDVDGYHWLH
ncbi:MAG TPA: hypothetical protein VIU93_10225 [Gallionellaceae bacterium]